jgi:hypothetical protein
VDEEPKLAHISRIEFNLMTGGVAKAVRATA